MSHKWRWVPGREHGWEFVLVGADAPYNRRLEAHAHAAIRRTAGGQYFFRLSSTRNGENEPTSYSTLADCQQACEKELKIRQVEDRLDGMVLP
jgi:hypothetical protein